MVMGWGTVRDSCLSHPNLYSCRSAVQFVSLLPRHRRPAAAAPCVASEFREEAEDRPPHFFSFSLVSGKLLL